MIKLVPDNVSMCSAVAIFSGCQMYAIEELERYGKPVDACGRIRAEEPRWMLVRKAPEQLIRSNGRLELAPIALTCEETGQRLNEKAVGYASPASANIAFLLGGGKKPVSLALLDVAEDSCMCCLHHAHHPPFLRSHWWLDTLAGKMRKYLTNI